jgi:hypothetical protein
MEQALEGGRTPTPLFARTASRFAAAPETPPAFLKHIPEQGVCLRRTLVVL